MLQKPNNMLKYTNLYLFVIIVIVFSILSPQFLSFSNLANVLIQGSAIAIIAIGMTYVLLTAGIDLSVGSVMFLTGVIGGKLILSGVPIWVTCIVMIIIGLVFGLMNGLFVTRFKLIPFIVTLSTYYIGRGLGLQISETRAINLPETFTNLGSATLLAIPVPILVLFIVVIFAHFVLEYSVLGRHIYALGNNKEKAIKAGIRVKRLLLLVYLISGGLAVIGGLVALSQLGAVSPTFGFQYEFMAIAAAVLGGTSLFGGKGSVPGTIAGAYIIQSLQSGLVMINADPYLYPIITGLVIYVLVMIDGIRNHSRINFSQGLRLFRR